MKRAKILVLFVMLMTVAAFLGGCKPKIKTRTVILVLENQNYMVLLDGTGPVSVSLKEGQWPVDLTSGDIVEIRWDGLVAETYPGQATIDSCKKVADGDLSDVDRELLNGLRQMGWRFEE